MFFVALVYVSALSLEALGSGISIVGLAAKAGWILIVLTAALDFSKIVIASVLYKKWRQLHLAFKLALIPVLAFLVVVTSTGTYAYLMQQFEKTTAKAEMEKSAISDMEAKRVRLSKRKAEMDGQVAQLPPDAVTARKRLTNLFSKEMEYVNSNLEEIDSELPKMKASLSSDDLSGGTLESVAEAYGTTPGKISGIIAFLMAMMVDPLAITLLTIANMLAEQRSSDASGFEAKFERAVGMDGPSEGKLRKRTERLSLSFPFSTTEAKARKLEAKNAFATTGANERKGLEVGSFFEKAVSIKSALKKTVFLSECESSIQALPRRQPFVSVSMRESEAERELPPTADLRRFYEINGIPAEVEEIDLHEALKKIDAAIAEEEDFDFGFVAAEAKQKHEEVETGFEISSLLA